MARAKLRALFLAEDYDAALDLMWGKRRGSRFFYDAETDKGILQSTEEDPSSHPPLVMFLLQLVSEGRPFDAPLHLYEVKTLELLLDRTPASFFGSRAALGLFNLMQRSLGVLAVVYGKASNDQMRRVAKQLDGKPYVSLQSALVKAAAEESPEADSLHRLLVKVYQAHSMWVFSPVLGSDGIMHETTLAYYLFVAKEQAREFLVREAIKEGKVVNQHGRPISFGGIGLLTAAVNTRQRDIAIRVARVVDRADKDSMIRILEAQVRRSVLAEPPSVDEILRFGELIGIMRVL